MVRDATSLAWRSVILVWVTSMHKVEQGNKSSQETSQSQQNKKFANNLMRDLECTKLIMKFTSMCTVFVSDRAGIWPMWNRSVILRKKQQDSNSK